MFISDSHRHYEIEDDSDYDPDVYGDSESKYDPDREGGIDDWDNEIKDQELQDQELQDMLDGEDDI
jgi:hypothetical protein